MKLASLVAVAAIAAASNYYPPAPTDATLIWRDKFKPKTRYRKSKLSPAQRLLESQRAKRAKAPKGTI